MTRRRNSRADQAVPPCHRAVRLLDHGPRGPDIRARRINGAGKTTCCGCWRGSRARPAARPRSSAAAATGSGVPGGDRIPGPGDPAVPAADRRGPHPGRRAHESPVGRRISPGPAARAEYPAGRSRRHAVRGPACPGSPRAHAGQAAESPAARRTCRGPGPARPAAFPGTLADAVARGGLTVILSSHLVADIERVCDHLILLSASGVQICGDIDAMLAETGYLSGRGRTRRRSHGITGSCRRTTPRAKPRCWCG